MDLPLPISTLPHCPPLPHRTDMSTPAFSTPPFVTVPFCPLPQIPAPIYRTSVTNGGVENAGVDISVRCGRGGQCGNVLIGSFLPLCNYLRTLYTKCTSQAITDCRL